MAATSAGRTPDDGEVGCANAATGMLEAMRRIVLIAAMALTGLAAVPVAGAIPLQTAAPVTARVSPGTGGPRTTFTLSWRNPAQTTTEESLAAVRDRADQRAAPLRVRELGPVDGASRRQCNSSCGCR